MAPDRTMLNLPAETQRLLQMGRELQLGGPSWVMVARACVQWRFQAQLGLCWLELVSVAKRKYPLLAGFHVATHTL